MFNAIVRTPQGCKESSRYKERMMKMFFLMLWVCFFAIVISGCVSAETDPHGLILVELGDDIKTAIDAEILEEDELWLWKTLWPFPNKAELYLKIYDKKNPEIFLLYPLNVGKEDSGTQKLSFITPFDYDKPTVLVFELLDDDNLDKEEVSLLVEAARTGTLIVCDAAAAYQCDYYAAEAIFRNKDGIASLAAVSGVRVLAKNINKHRFNSLGVYEYTGANKGGTFLNNVVTILNNDNKTKAHCKLTVYAVVK